MTDKLPEVRLRPAVKAEAPVLARLSRDLIEHDLHWRWRAPRIATLIASREHTVIVAVSQGRIVGFTALQLNDRGAHLVLFAVLTDLQRHGIGDAMLNWLVDTALTAGCEAIDLEVRATNLRGLRFYLQRDFVERVTLRGYYDGVEDAVRMRRTLLDRSGYREAHETVTELLTRFSHSKPA